MTYLRAHWPSAPEVLESKNNIILLFKEFIFNVAIRLASAESLGEVANHLGIQHVIRTGEFPPSDATIHATLFALFGIMDVAKARAFILKFVLPRIYEVPLEDVLPLREPYHVLRDYMKKWEKVCILVIFNY